MDDEVSIDEWLDDGDGAVGADSVGGGPPGLGQFVGEVMVAVVDPRARWHGSVCDCLLYLAGEVGEVGVADGLLGDVIDAAPLVVPPAQLLGRARVNGDRVDGAPLVLLERHLPHMVVRPIDHPADNPRPELHSKCTR